jgi:hypothetical protein
MTTKSTHSGKANTLTNSGEIPHLRALWQRVLHTPQYPNNQLHHDAAIDQPLLAILGLGLLPTYQFLHTHQPDYNTFEQWVIRQTGGDLSPEKIQACMSLQWRASTTSPSEADAVLTAEDLAFWDKQGYVIIKAAISKEDAEAGCSAIWEYLQMDAQIPESWYTKTDRLQGAMLPLYRHPAIDKNRQADRIRRAFEQLWQQTGLVVTTDKCGFTPPETVCYHYPGTGLHWDVSLERPIPFGTQGILYLTDTAAEQGALTLIPGFHKVIENWLQTLPPGTNPRNTDFSGFTPIPIAANAGDCIIWNHLLPHCGSANRANKPRLVQYLNWFPPLPGQSNQWV